MKSLYIILLAPKRLKGICNGIYPKFLYSFAKVCNVDTVLIEETSINAN